MRLFTKNTELIKKLLDNYIPTYIVIFDNTKMLILIT